MSSRWIEKLMNNLDDVRDNISVFVRNGSQSTKSCLHFSSSTAVTVTVRAPTATELNQERPQALAATSNLHNQNLREQSLRLPKQKRNASQTLCTSRSWCHVSASNHASMKYIWVLYIFPLRFLRRRSEIQLEAS